jgi:signal transduction histidine kinase
LVSQIKEKRLVPFAVNINRGAVHLSERIDELLDITKIELGLIQLNYNTIDLNGLLTDIVDYFKSEAVMNSINLNLDMPESLSQIRADERRIRQVIFNLLNNAFKYTNRGGSITIKAEENNERVFIEITDTDVE